MDQHLKVLQQKDRPKASETFHVTQIWSMLPWRPRATILSSQNQCIQSWGVPYKLEQSMLPAHRSPPSSAPPQKERVGAEHPSLPTGTRVGAALAHMDISHPHLHQPPLPTSAIPTSVSYPHLHHHPHLHQTSCMLAALPLTSCQARQVRSSPEGTIQL